VLRSTCPDDRKARVHFGSDWKAVSFGPARSTTKLSACVHNLTHDKHVLGQKQASRLRCSYACEAAGLQ